MMARPGVRSSVPLRCGSFSLGSGRKEVLSAEVERRPVGGTVCVVLQI